MFIAIRLSNEQGQGEEVKVILTVYLVQSVRHARK